MSERQEPISIDIETSSNRPETGEILSIGMVVYATGAATYLELRYDTLMVRPEAMAVNGIDVTTLADESRAAPTKADRGLRDFVIGQARSLGISPNNFWPMGVNVGSFDMQFINRRLPKLASCFNYRSQDLSTMAMQLSRRLGVDWRGLKEHVNVKAEQFVNSLRTELMPYYGTAQLGRHHALWDAYHNCATLAIFDSLDGVHIPDWIWTGRTVADGWLDESAEAIISQVRGAQIREAHQ